MSYTCDRCERTADGSRVVFTTEATDDSGIDVRVAKRWVTCAACADEVFSRLSMPSPWEVSDGRTVTFPDDDDLVATHAGGFTGSLGR